MVVAYGELPLRRLRLRTGANRECRWDKSHTYVNAIANELFLDVAAHLANRASNKAYYLATAQSQWIWFKNSGMINAQNNINDGLDSTTCKNNGGTVSFPCS